jgi:hypothetical protein
MKTVTFQKKGKYLDLIITGAKVEDYRAISALNSKLLCDHIDKTELKPGEQYVTHGCDIWRIKKDLTHVLFINGYQPDRKKLLCELKAIELNQFANQVPEGIVAGSFAITLILGRINHNSFI